jgi:hypothetical protein
MIAALAFMTAQAQQAVVHDAWLNWDIFNPTGQDVNDFEIVVDTPNYNPLEVLWDPTGQAPDLFPNFTTIPSGDDTILSWSGLTVTPGLFAHVGAWMQGSGVIKDAYWTLNGEQVGPSIPIIYEVTRITPPATDPRGDPEELTMRLALPTAFQGEDVFLNNMVTFANIPADLLALEDLNRDLDTTPDGLLAEFNTQPLFGNSIGQPIGPSEPIPPDSFFDVFVDIPPPGQLGPEWESLLFTEVAQGDPSQNPPIVRFWNLNPQSPEPSTLSIVLLAGIALSCRRK